MSWATTYIDDEEKVVTVTTYAFYCAPCDEYKLFSSPDVVRAYEGQHRDRHERDKS